MWCWRSLGSGRLPVAMVGTIAGLFGTVLTLCAQPQAPVPAPPSVYPGPRPAAAPSRSPTAVRPQVPAAARPNLGRQGTSGEVQGLLESDIEGLQTTSVSIPEFHTVLEGDTLWDISAYYLRDPWAWPKLWSYNPSVTNPHYIYPGDLVRVSYKNSGLRREDTPLGAGPIAYSGTKQVRVTARAFVSKDSLDKSFHIVGAVDEKEMLSIGDTIYLTYHAKAPPKLGATYSIFRLEPSEKHPTAMPNYGDYVALMGTAKIIQVAKDKRATAVVTRSKDAIERGDRIGAVRLVYESVPFVKSARKLSGSIVGMLGSDHLIGEGQLVFVRLDSETKPEVGNDFYVIRRGDALMKDTAMLDLSGQDDDGYPDRVLARIRIVEANRDMNVGMVIQTVREFGIGDRIFSKVSK